MNIIRASVKLPTGTCRIRGTRGLHWSWHSLSWSFSRPGPTDMLCGSVAPLTSPRNRVGTSRPPLPEGPGPPHFPPTPLSSSARAGVTDPAASTTDIYFLSVLDQELLLLRPPSLACRRPSSPVSSGGPPPCVCVSVSHPTRPIPNFSYIPRS